MKCENCGKEHDSSYGSGRFCSAHCKCSFNAKKCQHYPTKEQLKSRIGFGGIARSEGWTCDKCGQHFTTRAQLRAHSKIHPNNQGWSKGLTKTTDERVAKNVKNRKINPITGRIDNGCYGKHLSEETKQKQRIAMCNWLNSLPVNKHKANYNPNAIPVLEKIAKEHGWNIQHAMNGGEFYTGIGYFVDAYDKEKNVVLEYDEPVHYADIENNVLRKKDLKRQQEIIEHLHCEYWRYNEKMKLLWKVE